MKSLTLLALRKGLVSIFLIFCSHTTMGASSEYAEILDPLVEGGLLPGYYFAVYRDGNTLFERAKGYADESEKIEPTGETLYAMMSMTKPLMGLAVLMLVEDGKLKLRDPVSKFIPEFANVGVAPGGSYDVPLEQANRGITVFDLLTHTSGLTYSSGITGFGDVANAYRDLGLMTLESIAVSQWGDLASQTQKLTQLPLVSQPGERFIYSVSMDVLGRVVEIVSGQLLASFFSERIFEPLDMTSSSFRIPEREKERLARVYQPQIRTYPIPGNYNRYEPFSGLPKQQKNWGLSDQGYLSGGAGLISSANDYAKFIRLLADNLKIDGESLLSPELTNKYFSHQLPADLGDNPMVYSLGSAAKNAGYAFGLGVVPEKNGRLNDPSTYDYFFWQGAANTLFWVDKKSGVYGILLTQHIPIQYMLTPQLEDIADRSFK